VTGLARGYTGGATADDVQNFQGPKWPRWSDLDQSLKIIDKPFKDVQELIMTDLNCDYMGGITAHHLKKYQGPSGPHLVSRKLTKFNLCSSTFDEAASGSCLLSRKLENFQSSYCPHSVTFWLSLPLLLPLPATATATASTILQILHFSTFIAFFLFS
jgi:hypothetical protein